MNINNLNGIGLYNQLNKTDRASEDKMRPKKGVDYLSKLVEDAKSQINSNKVETNQGSGISRTNESNLSEKAQDLISSLREKYGDYDFFVSKEGDDLNEIAGAGTKEFSVIFSAEELEKMAADEEYAANKLQAMENAIKMTSGLLEEAEDGEQIDLGDGVSIDRVTIAFKEDGTMQIFAEAEKSTEKQRERIEKQREESANDTAKPNPYEPEKQVKKVMVEADSLDQLLAKIKDINWNEIQEENQTPGGRFNFSV